MNKMKQLIGSMTAKFAALAVTFGLAGGAWAAAQIGDTPYATLAEAVAAVPTDGTMTTITMTADEDSSSNVTIPEGVSITLDGGADPGYQVGTIVNNGTLRLKGYVIATKIVNNSTATQFGYDSYVTCDMENSEGATFTAGYGQAASHASITGNIVNRGTFTANQAGNTTANITISEIHSQAVIGAAGWVRFKSGLQIVFGSGSADAVVNFSVAFTDEPRLVMTSPTSSGYGVGVPGWYERTTTYFKGNVYDPRNNQFTSGGNFDYIAIGWWK